MIDMRIDVQVRTSGPLFDGRAERALREYIDEAEERIAGRGVGVLRGHLNRVLKTQTPYYRTRIAAKRRGSDMVIHDNMVIYGPWLAGLGSRNFPVTRFRGYDHLPRATEDIQRAAPDIAAELLRRKYLHRMNG